MTDSTFSMHASRESGSSGGGSTSRMLENEKHEEELARKVAEATLAQVSSKIKADLEQLKARALDKSQEAVQAAKDVKYIKERQGSSAACGGTMQRHHVLDTILVWGFGVYPWLGVLDRTGEKMGG